MATRQSVIWALLVVLATGAGWADTRYVNNNVSCSDSSCSPCCTIQAAVGLSSGGDIISVEPGNYPENIDFRGMETVGDVTLKASSGSGTVFVSPSSDHTVRHGGAYTNTVTIEGIDFGSSGLDKACIYLDHAGDVVLHDVTANNCAYTAFVLDNTGSVTMERCTANLSARTGIQVDGASWATLVDCTANSNPEAGLKIINVGGPVQITNPTAESNTGQGIDLDLTGPLTITGATVTGSGGRGIWVWSTNTVEITSSSVSGCQEDGVVLENGGVMDTIDAVTLTGLESNGNGLGGDGSGLYIEDVLGPVTLTDCIFDDNASDGTEIGESELTDLVITGGHAHRNGEHGFTAEAIGDAMIDGTHADDNGDRGFDLDLTGTVSVANCGADGNLLGSGIRIWRLDSHILDAVSVNNCTANDNGLASGGGGNGIYIKGVAGKATVTGTTTNGNSRTGIRVDDADSVVEISDAVSSLGLEEGIKIDADVGPVTVENCTADGNADEGLLIRKEDIDIETVSVTKNVFTNNGASGVFLDNLATVGAFDVTCNDIVGNTHGLYLHAATTVDARYVWWGHVSGPSGVGTGIGDSVGAEPGGTVLFTPWFTEPCASCVGVVHLTLADDSCIETESHEACHSITAGPNYGVYGPGGDLTLTAPLIMLENGFFVGIDGSLAAVNP